MRHRLLAVTTVILATTATRGSADTIGGDPSDPGSVTHVRAGVKELDVGGILLFSRDSQGDTSTTRLSVLTGAGFQYFLRDNLSLGAIAILSYDKQGEQTSAITYGGLLHGTLHLRLGLGAFLRPMLGIGGLFGKREIEAGMGGVVTELSQSAALIRIGLPIAYFAGRRVVLQAGPELNITVGSYAPEAGDSISFNSISAGFAVAVGYVF